MAFFQHHCFPMWSYSVVGPRLHNATRPAVRDQMVGRPTTCDVINMERPSAYTSQLATDLSMYIKTFHINIGTHSSDKYHTLLWSH